MANALMVRIERQGYAGPPTFRVVPSGTVNYHRWIGWLLLADEHEIRPSGREDARRSDIEDVRQSEIDRPINRPRWHR